MNIKKPKTKVFIDGANIFYTQQKLGWLLNWKRVIEILKKNYEIKEAKYYTGIKNNDPKMKKFLSYLHNVGIKTFVKPLKIIKDEAGKTIHKSNCDLEMAVDVLLDINHFDVLILFSGDSDFTYLIKILRNRFKKEIIVYSSRKTISWELRLTATDTIFLEDLDRAVRK